VPTRTSQSSIARTGPRSVGVILVTLTTRWRDGMQPASRNWVTSAG
jgi:hypothetical protein